MSYRNLFSLPEDIIYLDAAATTQNPLSVIQKIKQDLDRLAINPGRGDYPPARHLASRIEETREKIAKFIKASSPEEIVFTTGTTHGMNLAVYAWALANLRDGDQLLLCHQDHRSTILPWTQAKELLEQRGVKIDLVYYDRHSLTGEPDMDHIQSLISSRTRAIIVTDIHNVFGAKADLKAIRQAVGDEIVLIVDGSQSISHTSIDLTSAGVDIFLASGHKMFALAGSGWIFFNKRLHGQLHPFMQGGVGIHTDSNALSLLLETGTQNATAILSLGYAIDFIEEIGLAAIERYVKELTAYTYNRLGPSGHVEFLPGYAFNSENAFGIISFRTEGVALSDIDTYLSRHKIYLRSGGHCNMQEDRTNDSIRVSTHIYNTVNDIDSLANRLMEAINQ